MAGRIKVAVSPFYAGTEWVDKYTGIKFERNTNGMNVYSIPADANMTGIDDAIRLNALILMEGEIDPKWNDSVIEEPGRWTKTEVIQPEPKPVVRTETVYEYEEIPFETVEQETDELPEGQRETSQEGVVGQRTITIEVTYTDDQETGRQETDRKVTKEPVDEIIRVGTYVETPEEPADPEGEGEMGAMAVESFSIEGKNSDELKAYAEKNNITVEGSGKGGNVVKKDLEQAITAYQAEQNK